MALVSRHTSLHSLNMKGVKHLDEVWQDLLKKIPGSVNTPRTVPTIFQFAQEYVVPCPSFLCMLSACWMTFQEP